MAGTKYLKLFETHSEYQTYINGQDAILPNVSYCEDNNGVHYNPWTWAEEYLTFVALEDGTFTFIRQNNNVISYSLDCGETWVELAAYTATPTVTSGSSIMWKGTLTPTNKGIGTFTSTSNFEVKGNVMSLLYGDNYKGQTDLTGKSYAFYNMFKDNKKVISVEKLSLPATTLTNYCYSYMFNGCTALVNAPSILSATTLAEYCYYNMFSGCTSLVNAPELPATTLTNYCYSYMFNGCTALVTAPTLPATTLANYCYFHMFDGCTALVNAPSILSATTLASYCYQYMFSGCTSLVNVPELPATTLANWCYSQMFKGCTALVNAPELPATTLSARCYNDMFSGCTALVTAPTLSATTLATSCYGFMFNGCTSLVNAPELPATTLASQCYQKMFNGCTSLVNAPELPATTLVDGCYYNMFYDCTSLNYIKAMFTTTPSTTYTTDWVKNVAASGTFVKSSAAQWNVNGVNGVPTGWTVQTASE